MIKVHWSDVCRAAAGNELTITTADGKTAEGYCLKVDIDEIQLSTTKQGVVKIARTALSRIEMQHGAEESRLTSLGRSMRGALKQETGWIFSPAAPLGIAAVPATIAWGIVAAPFCAIGDLANADGNSKQQIQVI